MKVIITDIDCHKNSLNLTKFNECALISLSTNGDTSLSVRVNLHSLLNAINCLMNSP